MREVVSRKPLRFDATGVALVMALTKDSIDAAYLVWFRTAMRMPKFD